MTRRDWWLGITVLVLVAALHAAVPRFEYRNTGTMFFRIDRWTGTVERGGWSGGRWNPALSVTQFRPASAP